MPVVQKEEMMAKIRRPLNLVTYEGHRFGGCCKELRIKARVALLAFMSHLHSASDERAVYEVLYEICAELDNSTRLEKPKFVILANEIRAMKAEIFELGNLIPRP